MKYQRHNNTSSLFLLELILAVLFFPLQVPSASKFLPKPI